MSMNSMLRESFGNLVQKASTHLRVLFKGRRFFNIFHFDSFIQFRPFVMFRSSFDIESIFFQFRVEEWYFCWITSDIAIEIIFIFFREEIMTAMIPSNLTQLNGFLQKGLILGL